MKGFRQIAFLTAISRVLGMVRDMAFAYFLGRGQWMDIWVIAFKIPNLSRRIFGEGAASTSFIPVYSQLLEQKPKQALILARTIVTVVFLILCGVVVLAWIGLGGWLRWAAPLESTRTMLTLAAVMLPYMVLICTVALIAGILNAHRHFAAPAAAPVVLNLFLIGGLFVSGWLMDWPKEKMVFFLAGTVLAAGIFQILMQWIPLGKYGVILRPSFQIHSEGFVKVITLMGPMVLGLTVTQINTLADDVIAKCLSGSADKGDTFLWFGREVAYPVWAGSVSSLFYAQRLYQFPLGVLGISLATAIYPVMSRQAGRGDREGLARSIGKGVQSSFFVALPAMAGMLLIARPLIAVIFQRGEFTGEDTISTSVVLKFYAIGLAGFFCQQIVTRAFYSMQESSLPAKTAVLAVCLNVILNLTLIWFLGVGGLALSTALCSYLQVTILLVCLKQRFGSLMFANLAGNLIKTVTATGIMTGAGYAVLYLLRNLPETAGIDLIRIVGAVTVCSGVYLVCAGIMKNEMLSLLLPSRRKSVPDESETKV